MLIKDAKEIQLIHIVEHLGGRYSHTDRHDNLWYFSVFRPKEKTASFKVNPFTNKWYDFGKANIISKTTSKRENQSGGDVLDLWCDFNHRDRKAGIKQSLDELSVFSTTPVKEYRSKSQNMPIQQPKPPRYKVTKITESITHLGLKEELYRRRISQKVANRYLKQGYILDTVTGKKYVGFLFENDKGGYEVSIPNPRNNQSFKTCIGSKASTTLQPQKESTAAEIFEGFWDFLSWLEIQRIEIPANYTFVLNSVSFTNEVAEKVISFSEKIQSVFLFMDNDEAGEVATNELALFLSEIKTVGDKRYLWRTFKDLNIHWKNQSGRY